MLQKIVKFLKENLAPVLGIAAVVISCLFMLLPGQFANLRPVGPAQDLFTLNGYQFFFNTKVIDGTTYYPASHTLISKLGNEAIALPAGIIILVLFVLATASLVLYKKSSALFLLGGVLLVTASVFFFAMEANAINIYGLKYVTNNSGKETTYAVIKWVSYVNAVMLLLAGAFNTYKAIIVMKNEIVNPAQPKGPTYSYLKK